MTALLTKQNNAMREYLRKNPNEYVNKSMGEYLNKKEFCRILKISPHTA
jgi:hypothetical protein